MIKRPHTIAVFQMGDEPTVKPVPFLDFKRKHRDWLARRNLSSQSISAWRRRTAAR